MTSRAGAGLRVLRSIGGIGAIAVVLTACGIDTRPRVRADEWVLIEITGPHSARITVKANQPELFTETITPRGGPPTTSTTSTTTIPAQPLTAAQGRAAFEGFVASLNEKRVTGISQPRATVTAVGNLIGHHAIVTRIGALPDRLTSTLHFSQVDPTVRFRPASVVRAIDRNSRTRMDTIWVGVCVKPTQGRWTRTSDTYDRSRGCAGWVPDRQAASIGVLHAESPIASETWMIALLALGAALLAVTGIARWRVRPLSRVRALWIVPAIVFVGTLAVEFVLVGTALSIGRLQDIFGASLENPTRQLASKTAFAGLAVAIAAFLILLWSFSQPPGDDRRRRWVAKRPPVRHAPIRAFGDPV